MIDKKIFCEALKQIIEIDNRLERLSKVSPSLTEAIIEFSLQDVLIDVLASAMNLPTDDYIGNTIAWWVYETDYGQISPVITVQSKNGKRNKEFDLDTIEKLYDSCVKESKDK